jgi:hypothetical protein
MPHFETKCTFVLKNKDKLITVLVTHCVGSYIRAKPNIKKAFTNLKIPKLQF